MRAFILAVTGLGFIVVAACSSYGTSVIEVKKQVQVASVSVALPSVSLVAGQTQRARATVKDANGVPLTGRSVVWYSSSASVASVTDSGVVSAINPGTATLSAVSEGISGQAPLTVIPQPPASVARVLVAITPSAVVVGQTAHATVTLQDSIGNPLTGRPVTWNSSNTGVATVSASGDVSAIASGTAAISAASEGKTASAPLTVTAPPPVAVASVSVSPPTSTLQVGATLQLSAVTRDANNNVLTGRAISWISNNAAVASVSASGFVTAVGAGNAQINATSETQIGTATLTVTSPPPPPPPPPGAVWRGNEPAGMTALRERAFNALNDDPAWKTMVSPAATIAVDGSAPQSPSSVLRINYPAGFAGGSSPEFTETGVPSLRVLYTCYWVKFSANWQGHNTGINKLGYTWFDNTPAFVAEAEGVGSSPLVSRMAIQYSLVQPNSDGWYGQNLVPNAVFTRGQWDLVEIVLTGNSAGTADGILDWYLNGVHVGHYAGIQWSSAATLWNLTRIYPVWGGIGDVVRADQYIQWDHIYVSGKH
jgi:uncharacterized protein YjdB